MCGEDQMRAGGGGVVMKKRGWKERDGNTGKRKEDRKEEGASAIEERAVR